MEAGMGGMGSGSSKGTVSRISSSTGMESGASLGVATQMAKASSEGATKEKTEGQAMIENVATLLKKHGAMNILNIRVNNWNDR
jgi:hypothetical protein